MSDHKCIVCNRPMLTTDEDWIKESNYLDKSKLICRCVQSDCMMSNIWLPVEVLDKFERLQFQRNNAYDELGWSRDINIDEFVNAHDKVYCTADGEYPDHDDNVIFQCFCDEMSSIGYFSKTNNCFVVKDSYAYYPENYAIYWKHATSLKDEYERQKEEE